MKRTRLIAAPLAVMALVLGACGSDGPKTLSEDDFVTQMNSICRSADRAIKKLDVSDKSYFDDAIDIVDTAVDDLGELKPPKALAGDVEDYIANLTDFSDGLDDLSKAVDDGDDEEISKVSDDLDDLNSDNDDLADSIGAEKCIDVGGDGGTVETIPDTVETIVDTVVETTDAPETTDSPDTTDPVETFDTTDTTDTPNTPLSIDTTPDTLDSTPDTITDDTSSGTGIVASDASIEFQPIADYTWGTLEDIEETITPTDDPTLGPILDGYYVGVMEGTEGPVYVYVTVLSQTSAWTAEQLDAYYSFELVNEGGVDGTTPGLGLPARTKLETVEGYDGGVFTIDGFGVSLLAPSGADMLALLDGFATAQTTMGS